MIKTHILKAIRRITSGDETRIAICGIYFDATDNLLIGTDGRRLIAFECLGIDASESFIMSNDFIDSLPNHSEISITLKDRIITALLPGQVNYSCPAPNVEFPKWRGVLPNPWPDKFDLRKLAANIVWLAEVCQIGEQIGEGPGFVVTSHGEIDSVICVRSKLFTGLLMPIRAVEEGYSKPSWFTGNE